MLSFTDKLLQYIFRELEKSPNRSFRVSELKHISSADFDRLLKEKLLKYYRYEPEGDNYPCADGCSSCNSGYMRTVARIGKKWEAICTDSEADTKSIPLTEDDITQYAFDINRFIEIIRKENNLGGNYEELNTRIYFIGSLNIKSKSTAIVLALCSNPKTAGTLLLSIPSQTARYQASIVLMPFFDKIQQGVRGRLEDKNLHIVNFADAFGDENWVISQDVFSKISQKEKSIPFSKAKKSKIDLTESVFQYKNKKLPELRNQLHKLFLRILEKVSGKTKDTYIPLKDIVRLCGWKIEDYNSDPKNYKNRISVTIGDINKALESAGLPTIGRLDSKRGYLCPITLKDIEIILPASSGKARPNIKRLEESINTSSSENE